MKRIPSVNLQDFLSNDSQKKSDFVKSIGTAFQDIGFCAVHGHFLDDDLVSRLYEQIKLFFDLPIEVKLNTNTQNTQAKEVMFHLGKKVQREVSMGI